MLKFVVKVVTTQNNSLHYILFTYAFWECFIAYYLFIEMKVSMMKIRKNAPEPKSVKSLRNSLEDKVEESSLSISNEETRYRLFHGDDFKGLLDARDQVL